MKKIALISCSKNKMDYDCVAKIMYSKSILFKKSFSYCVDQNYSYIFILSAKYGLLNPSEIISPYELTLNSFNNQQKKEWAKKCFEKISDMGLIDYRFDFYTGAEYFKELSKLLPCTNNILQGLGIGERLKFLNK